MARIGQKNQKQIFLNVSGTKSNFLGSPYLAWAFVFLASYNATLIVKLSYENR